MIKSLITGFVCLFIVYKILDLKKSWLLFLIGFGFSILLYFSYNDSFYRIVANYLFLIIVLFLYSKINIIRLFLVVFFMFLILAISEIVYFLVMMSFVEKVKANLFSNLMIGLLSIGFFYLGNPLWKRIKLINFKQKYSFYILFVMMVAIISFFMYRLYFATSIFENIIISCFFILIIFWFVIFWLKELYKYRILESGYQEAVDDLIEYEKLIDHFRLKQHEHKNELLFLKSRIDDQNLIDDISLKLKEEDFVDKINLLPKGGIKGLLYKKVFELKESGVKVEMVIGKGIYVSDFEVIKDTCSVLAIILDNAKEACLQVNKPYVEIIVSLVDNEMVFIVSNNYCGMIDVEKINVKGVSSKGGERGFGLFIADWILQKNDKLVLNTKIRNNLFVQELKVIG